MDKNPMNNDSQNEIDILALFEYFKKGIKSIFKGVNQLIQFILKLTLNLLYLIYKNWILVFGLMILFGALGMFKNSFLSPKFKYEMIVEPKLNSTFELYDNVSNLSQIAHIELSKKEGLTGIEVIEISPIKRLSDEVRLYYSVPKNTDVTGSPDIFGLESDTVFYRSTEFKDFQLSINNFEYPIQKIIVKSKNAIDTEKLRSLILEPFVQSQKWKNVLNSNKSVLTKRKNTYENFILRADSLLSAYAKKTNPKSNSEISISGTNTKNNVENDILNQVKIYSRTLESLQVKLNNTQEIVKVLSDFKRVEDDSTRSHLNLWTGLIFGLLIALFILLIKYSLNFFKNYTPK